MSSQQRELSASTQPHCGPDHDTDLEEPTTDHSQASRRLVVFVMFLRPEVGLCCSALVYLIPRGGVGSKHQQSTPVWFSSDRIPGGWLGSKHQQSTPVWFSSDRIPGGWLGSKRQQSNPVRFSSDRIPGGWLRSEHQQTIPVRFSSDKIPL